MGLSPQETMQSELIRSAAWLAELTLDVPTRAAIQRCQKAHAEVGEALARLAETGPKLVEALT